MGYTQVKCYRRVRRQDKDVEAVKMNEGTIDRLIRIVLGAALTYIGYTLGGGVWSIVLYVLAAVAVVTGITGFCLLYRLFGNFSTAKKA
jgi:hypothetical protein